MNILITSPIFPPDLGGPATYVPSFASWLVARGHSVTVVAFCSDPNPTGWPFRVVAVERCWMPLRYLRDFLQTWRAAKHADVVYINEHLALHVAFAARLRGVPSVIRTYVDGTWEITHRLGWHRDTIDDYQLKEYGWRVTLLRRLQRTWWGWVRRIIVPSDFIRRLVEGHGVTPQKIELIHNAYHGPEVFEPTRAECRARLGLPQGQVVLLSICRLMAWKGVDGLIRALARLPESHHLWVCGDGDEQENWTRLAEGLGVGPRVHFLGNVPHARVMEWIRAADCFLLNSNYEGLSHTLLEVMWLGLPAAVSAAGGNVELIEDRVNGRSFRPQDVDAIVDSVREIAGRPEVAARYAQASRRKVVAGFSREAIFTRTEALLAGAAGREPPAAHGTPAPAP
ncbi:MAG: glycosyltransferase family 4 protein [Planctomycetes bacterium]|nr:glycosyltransferase family 4 protein [Planctomycetota bacterium]